MDRKSFAFDKKNFILLGIGMVIIIIGFLLRQRSSPIFSVQDESK